jgi:DNA modification methylase
MTTIHVGDCREVMAEMEPESIDAIVTDPPYELNFMSKGWDRTGVAFTPDTWREAYRVLKPGGHLLAFGGTRTVHRLACAIEDAGFEIRDQVVWLYGSGFPKSLDVSKAIDKVNGETDRLPKFTSWMRTTGLTAQQINDATGTFMGSHYLTSKSQPAIPTPELWTILRPLCGDVPAWVDQLVERIAAEREVVGEQSRQGKPPQFMWGDEDGQSWDITAPATPDAERWQGWGTALKPAHEPVVVARKPLIGTVAANVLTHGTGALNVDGCRIETNPDDALAMERANTPGSGRFNAIRSEPGAMGRSKAGQPMDTTSGRWPANVVLDEDAAAMLDAQSGEMRSTKPGSFQRELTSKGYPGGGIGQRHAADHPAVDLVKPGYGDTGGASRFFYCAKASRSEREAGLGGWELRAAGVGDERRGGSMHERYGDGNGSGKTPHRANNHPCVKPVALMRWLVRLVTPEGGLVLDPFTGSGTTGIAAAMEGRRFLGIEREAEYVEIARARIAHHAPTQTELGVA